MKRLHVHIHVEDLAASIRFYASLFGGPPSQLHDDYAKWSLEDPLVNFAISRRGFAGGLDHLGIEVEDDGALGEVTARLAAAGNRVVTQKDTACCYARSDKAWVKDPQGIAWETFFTRAPIPAGSGQGEAASCCGDSTCAATPGSASQQEAVCCP